MMKNELKLFQNQKIRTSWNDKDGEWYFSVVDVCAALTDSENPRRYWSDLKRKLNAEGAIETYENIVRLKMLAADGKNRVTDAVSTKNILRIIQSIHSPKAEPFKLWLAEVGNDRLNEIVDPELAIERAVEYYRRKGHSEEWISQRLRTIEMRKELTDEWKRSGATGSDYAILTDEISKTWSGMTTREYKNLKGLKKESLRDNMSNLELALNMLAEVSTTEISKSINPVGLEESKNVARQGGTIAKNARIDIEQRTGKTAISNSNNKRMKELSASKKEKQRADDIMMNDDEWK